MASLTIDSAFEPPGPGSWTIDAAHFPRPATRYWAEMHPEPAQRGYREFTRYYGIPIDAVQFAYVNGFAYTTVTRVPDQEIAQRDRRAREVLEHRLWRDQLRDWDQTFKPASITTHRELQSVDPAGLADADLVAYLIRCRDHHIEMIYQHMRFTGAAMVTIGDLLAHTEDWTDVPSAELLSVMRGSAPTSAGASGELDRMIAAISDDPEAQRRMDSNDDAGKTLAELRALPGETGPAVSAYLDLTGYRLLDGFDISGRYALELPDALLRAIRAAVAGRDGADSRPAVEAQIAQLRARVPDPHRDEFDELLSEARLMYRIRDERGVFSDIWASGIMRRAAIAAGRRLADRGQIHEAEHFVDAGFDEMRALVSDTGRPSADELARRFTWRTSHTAKEAPATLGPPPTPPPDPASLPPFAARMMRASAITRAALHATSQAPHEEQRLRGLGASGGVYEGPARRVAGPSEFDRIVQGDVLVTESTTEAFNILLPLLGAIVTDSGGLLSHSAIVAREYGIPGVVGTRDGTGHIPDGALVRVDGDAGEVVLLA
jgi:pyruvate,water dikinase